MSTPKHAKRVEELYNSFRRVYSADADEAVMKRCFEQIVGVHEKRKFPDLAYLEHTHAALDMLLGAEQPHTALRLAAWYQHCVVAYLAVDLNVENACKELPSLGVSHKVIDDVTTLIRSTSRGIVPRGREALMLADANTYATYGVSWDRTNGIVVLKAKQHNHTANYVQRVVGEELVSVRNGKLYFSGEMMERFGEQTRDNIRETLRHLKYIGKDKPKHRKLK